MLRKLGLWVARVLDVLGWKSVSRSLFARLARAGDGEYAVYWAAWERMRRGDVGGAEGLLRGEFAARGSPKVGRLLVHLLLRQGRYEEARQVAADMQTGDPGNPWLLLLLGDLHAYFGGDGEFAAGCYERALGAARAWRGWGSPLKVVYKRLVRLYWSRGDLGRVVPLLEEFASWRASNFYASGFEMLYRAHLALGNAERAKEVLLWGLREMPRSFRLRALAEEAGLEGVAAPVATDAGLEGARTCVRTRLLTEVDDPVVAVREHVRAVGCSDVVALSSCVAGVMEGRFQMAGAISPCLTARVLSRFVDQTDVPFGGMAPLASPLAMQVLVEEVGTVRVWVAALAEVVGKLLGRKGWFYLVAGPQSALIDDVPGSLPPYDYYVIMGPADPPGLAQRIADALGCEAAIVDANDRQVAWAVGCSRGVDRRRLEALMSDNPAGNQDQQTPVVIVRGACRNASGEVQRAVRVVTGAGAGRLVRLRAQRRLDLRRVPVLRRAAVLAGALGVAVLLVFLAVHGSFWRVHHLPGPRSPAVPAPRPVQMRSEGVGPCQRVPILMYHAVASRRGRLAGLYVTPEEFREEVRYLRVHGYHAVTLRQLEEAWAGRGELPARPIVITFDDGYLGQYTYALPELRRAGYVATLFLTVNRLGAKDGLTPAMVREMLAAGWELGSHTLSHPDLTRVPLPWLRREVEGSRQALQGLFRVEVVSFCYPSGRVDARVEEEVRRAGYLVACGTAPGLGDAGEMFALRRIRVSGGDGARGLAAKLRSFATVACTTRSARAQISPP